eukprot:9072497-Alexandrium_andersonii.AAC.1
MQPQCNSPHNRSGTAGLRTRTAHLPCCACDAGAMLHARTEADNTQWSCHRWAYWPRIMQPQCNSPQTGLAQQGCERAQRTCHAGPAML